MLPYHSAVNIFTLGRISFYNTFRTRTHFQCNSLHYKWVPDILLGMPVASLCALLGSNPTWHLAPLDNSFVFLRTSPSLTEFIFCIQPNHINFFQKQYSNSHRFHLLSKVSQSFTNIFQ